MGVREDRRRGETEGQDQVRKDTREKMDGEETYPISSDICSFRKSLDQSIYSHFYPKA